MSRVWTQRAYEFERMDVETLSPDLATRVLDDLESVNRWLGGVAATLRRLEIFAARWKPGERIRIVDWGTGGADVPRAILRWALKRGHPLSIIAVESNPVLAEEARRRCRGYPEIEVVHADAREWTPTQAPVDYAISSLVLHHLDDEAIVGLLQRSDRLARRGLIMNDLIRSTRAAAWYWALSRTAFFHPIVRSDGALSIRRAFTSAELAGYARQAGLSYLTVSKHFGYRMTLSGEK